MMAQRFKVGGITYTAKEVDTLDDGILGEVDYRKCEITIDSSISLERRRQTLIHELFHAILMESGFDDQDEELVNRAAIVLYQTLVDNDFSFLRDKEAISSDDDI